MAGRFQQVLQGGIRSLRNYLKYYYQIALIFTLLVVVKQTYSSRHAFFYSDDFTYIAKYDQGINWVFENINGHFLPIGNFLYLMMFHIFGIGSFYPFLLFSAACNLYLGISFIIFLKSFKFDHRLIILGGPLLLVIPYGAHTIFWPAAACNLLIPGFIFNFLCIKSRSKIALFTFLFIAFGIGQGGYGFVLVAGVMCINILKCRWKIVGYSLIPLFLAGLVYLSAGDSTVSYLSIKFPIWILNSTLNFIHSFAPIITEENGITILLEITFLVCLFISFLPSGKFIMQIDRNKILTLRLGFICTAAFVFLLWPLRAGVEPFTASRYIGIFNCFFVMILIAGSDVLISVINSSNFRNYLTSFFVFFLGLIILLRLPLWYQSPRDISYQSLINRTLVNQLVCVDRVDPKVMKSAVESDGLSYLENSLSSSLWKDYRNANCRHKNSG